MKTQIESKVKTAVKNLILSGNLEAASRIIRSLSSGCSYISLGISDTDWNVDIMLEKVGMKKYFGSKTVSYKLRNK